MEGLCVSVAKAAEIGVVGLHDDASDDQRSPDVEHPVGFRGGMAVDSFSEFAAGAPVYAVGRLGSGLEPGAGDQQEEDRASEHRIRLFAAIFFCRFPG